ncbi:MAG: Zn-ribbon domain-containing OB-fold protein [Alphaproteobacteria bacterium]
MTANTKTANERTYPAPNISLETEAYWAAANEGKLLMKKCSDCDKTHFYPRAICPHCHGANTEWYEASGKGVIYSYSVMRRGATPYAIAYVTVDEGITMMTNIVDCDYDALAVGQSVEVTFRQSDGGGGHDQAIPVFRPT